MLRNLIETLVSRARRFRHNDEAVAAVEFALILPFLLALYFGSMEASQLFTANRRVNTISATMGDLVSQWDNDDGSIPVATMTDYLKASLALIYPMPTTGLKQVVTCVQVLADGTTKIIWSKGYNGGVARIVNATYPLANIKQLIIVARGGYVIAAETSYAYTPLLGEVFKVPVNLYHENLYIPRFGGIINAS